MAREPRALDTVGVVGLGTMGSGIVEVLARSGLDVVGVEVDEAALARGRGALERSTARAVERGRLTGSDRDRLLSRVQLAGDYGALARCDLVVEAVPERLDLKREVMAEVDAVVRADAVLATNTSSLSVTEIAVATRRPDRVVGLHFFNPAPVLRLVEVVRTVLTEDDVVADAVALAERLGKTPVVVADRAGFVANALLFGYLNRAVGIVESGQATREDVDAAMVLGAGLPMGPLALLDLIGLDTALQVLESMYDQGRDRLHAPNPLLRELVVAGAVGRKAGRGFYPYAEPGSGRVVADPRDHGERVGSHERVREVNRAAVLGSAELADDLAGLLAAAGPAVLRVDPAVEPLEAVGDVDLVVIAVDDDSSAASALFGRLDEICRPGAVLATATWRVPVIECAAATSRPRDVVGLHLPPAALRPAAGPRLVEVVASVSTADDVVASVLDLCRRAGAHPVRCADRAGFLVGGLMAPYLNDAVRMLQDGYADADAIDTAMTQGCGYPAGPLAVLDEVGLDVALQLLRRIYDETREPGLAPAPLLRQLVTAGFLGRRAGRGVRRHE